MPIKVLVVDDSSFYRNRIVELLNEDSRIKVVGHASNGLEAVSMVKRYRPDVVTMDVEMPKMNGIDALKIIMRDSPTHVLMFSAHTSEGAASTIRALEAGAADYFLKESRAWIDPQNPIKSKLVSRIVALSASRMQHSVVNNTATQSPTTSSFSTVQTHHLSVRGTSRSEAKVEPTLPLASGFGAAFNTVTPEHKQTSQNTESLTNHRHHVHSVKTTGYDVVVIGASTGGPAALQNVLTKLPAHFPLPILLVQHMPGSFTTVFAERLNQLCNIKVKEAEDGDILYPGCAYLAPGGMQMILDPTNKQRLRVVAGEARLTYKPSVDITFASVARGHAKTTLAVILTGMGADGTEGSRHLIKQGATIWAQDEKTSTIWGMPKSVIKAGLADNELSLNEIGDHLSRCRRA